jgi:radical SAM superfamily enzyme YgiQ (UPF0313 family)
MKILMINPPSENTVIECPDDRGEDYIDAEDYGAFPPLGALYVLSYLEKHLPGHELFFKDCVAERISHAALRQVIEDIKPDVVGVTSFTISLVDVCKVAETARAVVPGAHICMGGHHPIAFPFEAAQLPQFDSVVVGEGEEAFTELVDALDKGKDFTGIRGVYTARSIQRFTGQAQKDSRFLAHVMVPPAYIEDIDSLPFPNRNFIKHIDYHSIVGSHRKLATIISSRGCPYSCTFCDVPYKRYRERDVGSVLDEVQQCLDMGYQEFHFYDDLFNITPKKVIAFCDAVEQRRMKFVWDFRGRVNTVTRESLERAKRAGLRQISFGVETGTDEGLQALKKGAKVEQAEKVFRWCRELGIRTIADYMVGLPFERTREDVERNLDFLIGLDPDYMQLSVLSLYPNTKLFDQAVERGLVQEDRWRRFSLNPTRDFVVDHWEEFFSVGQMVEMQKQAYRRFYLRPRYILRSALQTRTWFEFQIKAKGALKVLGLKA